MRNAVLPFVPSSNYDFGNINYELQMFNESDNISGFCLETKEFDNNDNKQSFESFPIQLSQGLSAFPQSPTIFGSDIENTISSRQNYSMFIGKKILSPQHEMENISSIRNTRKRSIEVNDIISPKIGIGELFSDHIKLSNLKSKNKRSKVTNNDQEWKYQVRETLLTGHKGHKLKMPVKKSQKLTHKITALQKLVSPYGKTDTASVLQEASLYINLLQEQIQNLFRMLSSSYDSFKNPSLLETGKRRLELKGFCLVPISFTEKVSFMEERNIDHNKYRCQ